MRLKIFLLIVLVTSAIYAKDKKTKKDKKEPGVVKVERHLVGEKSGIRVDLNLDKYLKASSDMYKVSGRLWNKTSRTLPRSRYNTFKIYINDKMLIVYIDYIKKMYAGSYSMFSVRVNEDDYPQQLKDLKTAKGEIYIGVRKISIPLKLKLVKIVLKN